MSALTRTQPLELSNAIMAPIRSHQESTIEILQGTFEHINLNPLFDKISPIPKYPKRMLRLDFKTHIIWSYIIWRRKKDMRATDERGDF